MAGTAILSHAQVAHDPPVGRPDAIIDLSTREGVALIKGQWRNSDTRIVEVDYRAPGTDLKPSGKPIKTYDYAPKAGAADFDDSRWEIIDPPAIDGRRSTGKVCFNWYRIKVTIPERVGNFDPTGSTVAFEVVIDDYAEVWVNGQLPAVLGQSGGSLVRGFNAPNRLIIGQNAKPGQQFQIAVLAINGPISKSPDNFIWIKSATLDFYKSPVNSTGYSTAGTVERLDPSIDRIVPADPKIERIATGFTFTEGPVWVSEGNYLLFSDPNSNLIYRWTPDGALSIYRTKSGYAGMDIGEYSQPGSNGLTLDREGRLTIDEMGNRRVTRLERNGVVTILADNFHGERLNSPNDLVYKSDGSLYFSDLHLDCRSSSMIHANNCRTVAYISFATVNLCC